MAKRDFTGLALRLRGFSDVNIHSSFLTTFSDIKLSIQ